MTTVQVSIAGIHITNVQPRAGETIPRYSGAVRLSVHHTGFDGGNFETSHAFEDSSGVEAAILQAVTELAEYAEGLKRAAEKLTAEHSKTS
jgi:hypothetical protein